MLNHENGSAYFKNLPLCNTAKYCSYFVKIMIRKGIMNLEKEPLRNVFQRPSEKTRKLFRLLCNSTVALKTANHPKPPETSWKQSETTQKPSKTTRNFLKLTQNFTKLAIISHTPTGPPHFDCVTSRQFLPGFSTVDLEHKLIVRKVKVGKDDENPSNGHGSQIVDSFSEL